MDKYVMRLVERMRHVIKNNGYIIKEIKGENNTIDFVLLKDNNKNNDVLLGNLILDISATNNMNTMSLNKDKMSIGININSPLLIVNIVFTEEV